MAGLWESSGRSSWQSFLQRYPHALAYVCSKKATVAGRESLSMLDKWVWDELTQAVQEAKYCTLPQLIKLTEWKMTRGQWRARNKQLVSSNDADLVKDLSQEAFALIEEDYQNLKTAISKLSKLKGVGPATASALLACYCPLHVAFMSDEAVKCTGLQLQYTMKNYLAFNDKLVAKWKELDDNSNLTINDLQQALWSATYCEKGNIEESLAKEDVIPIKTGKRVRETKIRASKRQKTTK